VSRTGADISWVHSYENKSAPAEKEKFTDPERLSWGEPKFYFLVGIRLSLYQRPVAKNWGRTDDATTQKGVRKALRREILQGGLHDSVGGG